MSAFSPLKTSSDKIPTIWKVITHFPSIPVRRSPAGVMPKIAASRTLISMSVESLQESSKLTLRRIFFAAVWSMFVVIGGLTWKVRQCIQWKHHLHVFCVGRSKELCCMSHTALLPFVIQHGFVLYRWTVCAV